MTAIDAADLIADLAYDSVQLLAALARINTLIGNERTITAERLGEVRGVVLDAMQQHYARSGATRASENLREVQQ